MTRKEIEFFIYLKKSVSYERYVYVFLMAFSIAYWVYEAVREGGSLFPSVFQLVVFFFLVGLVFRGSDNEKSCRIIESFINKDAELMVALNEAKNESNC